VKNLPTYEDFLIESDSYELDYETYCLFLDEKLNENFLSGLKDKAVAAAMRVLGPIREFLQKIAEDFKVGIGKVVEAFRQRSVFEFLKAIRFNFRSLIKAFSELTGLIKKGLFGIFETISKTGVVERLRSGAMKIDQFLDEYPLIKRVGGLVIAGILIYMWLNMTFIGDFDFDFNLGDVTAALVGKFAIADLFLGPSGLVLITLFVTGPYISVPWLGSSIYNMCIALFYTGYVKLKESDMNVKAAILKIVKN